MDKKNILVVAGPELDKKAFAEWTPAESIELSFVDNDEGAIEMFHRQNFDMVLIDTSNERLNVKKLQTVLPLLNDETELILFNAGPARELHDQIMDWIKRTKMQRIQRILVFDSAETSKKNIFPAFSAN